ncbi:hypothetical protein VSS74_01290 [Conexibacter stalactiti]|uniref:GAF domain-containing protein n=1 Tax=Conexibacter stalactiti TaxID=1940611 RepID=A0ABU4HI21_9ACTN|nr:hypothetical protein [Conexibacter stalactiti]MDW5592951.1 hypothetical protein [Conexibacter stalactiti]MEC5033592.1 hypothetical protein [Conexibacter stalactiti]
MALEPLTSRLESPFAVSALRALARVAGEGEVRAHAARLLETSREALEISGWLLLQELRIGRVEIRHGLIGPGGVAVVVPGGPSPRYEHLAEADCQAQAIAELLRIDRPHVLAVVCIMDSHAAPREHVYPEASGVVVGDRHLPVWLGERPTIIGADTLTGLRDAIFAQAERAEAAAPLSLPSEPRWG